jgi:hypothetical protein
MSGTTRDVLDRIEVASPCTQDWNRMTGDEKRRFCGECRLHVHDLSAMTRNEAEDLLRGADGRVCVRFYRRPDGRVLTKDCVTVRDRIRRRARRLRVAAAALFAFLAPFVGGCGAASSGNGSGGGDGVIIAPEDPPIMGDVCVPEDFPVDGGEDDDTGAIDPVDPEDVEPLMGEVWVEPQEMLGRVALPPPPPAKDDDRP